MGNTRKEISEFMEFDSIAHTIPLYYSLRLPKQQTKTPTQSPWKASPTIPSTIAP